MWADRSAVRVKVFAFSLVRQSAKPQHYITPYTGHVRSFSIPTLLLLLLLHHLRHRNKQTLHTEPIRMPFGTERFLIHKKNYAKAKWFSPWHSSVTVWNDGERHNDAEKFVRAEPGELIDITTNVVQNRKRNKLTHNNVTNITNVTSTFAYWGMGKVMENAPDKHSHDHRRRHRHEQCQSRKAFRHTKEKSFHAESWPWEKA